MTQLPHQIDLTDSYPQPLTPYEQADAATTDFHQTRANNQLIVDSFIRGERSERAGTLGLTDVQSDNVLLQSEVMKSIQAGYNVQTINHATDPTIFFSIAQPAKDSLFSEGITFVTTWKQNGPENTTIIGMKLAGDTLPADVQQALDLKADRERLAKEAAEAETIAAQNAKQQELRQFVESYTYAPTPKTFRESLRMRRKSQADKPGKYGF